MESKDETLSIASVHFFHQLHIGAGYFTNLLNLKRFEVSSAMNKLRETVDKNQ